MLGFFLLGGPILPGLPPPMELVGVQQLAVQHVAAGQLLQQVDQVAALLLLAVKVQYLDHLTGHVAAGVWVEGS